MQERLDERVPWESVSEWKGLKKQVGTQFMRYTLAD